MKLSQNQVERIVKLVFNQLKANKIIIFKEKEEKAFLRAIEIVKKNIEDEKKIEIEANQMLDELERTQGGTFQRHKMLPMIKKELAKKKGFVL